MSELTKSDAALAVLEEVLLASRRAAEQAQAESGEFNVGLKAAYYDVLTVALEQAELVGLSPAEFGLKGYNPDVLLRPNQSKAA
ncbi:MAG: hypothetical protein HQL47_07795 [Gammaproteobacteria bacterium]|nr:hypothetical protein [Gammaproteobacteria bacterium]